MCGITGWFTRTELHEGYQVHIDAMTDSLQHRGPDGQGTRIYGHAALGHTRLAIIDREGGAQPFHSADAKLALIYNGEIYNHAELRQELEAEGHAFRTRSDTEVVMQVLQHWGTAGLGRLRGMYALALWNESTQSGLLARDPLGIKPLFVNEASEETLAFGSEAKAILKGGHPPELDPGQLHLLMNFRYLPAHGSLFKGIRQLLPGEILHWSAKTGLRQEFVSPRFSLEDMPVIDRLRDSVRSHLVSDVPVGVYLSGGIDSACVAALSDDSLAAFTLDVGDDPKEAENAAASAKILGLPHTLEQVGFNAENDLMRLLWHLEVPKINALQGNLLARVASQNVKVALSGLGGDEMFMGYNAHRLYQQFSRAPGFTRRLANLGAGTTSRFSKTPWSEAERAMRMAASRDPAETYGLLRNVWDNTEFRQRFYAERMLDQELPDAFDVIRMLWTPRESALESMREFEWRHKMTGDLLWNEDRVSMAEGLEVRVPLVDSHILIHLNQFSAEDLMRGGQQKAVFRDSLKGVLPDEILNRPKSGFQVDSPQFFQSQLAEMAKTWLSEERTRHYGVFNPGWVAELQKLSVHKKHRWHYFQLYLMLLTHLWLALFEEDAWSPS